MVLETDIMDSPQINKLDGKAGHSEGHHRLGLESPPQGDMHSRSHSPLRNPSRTEYGKWICFILLL